MSFPFWTATADLHQA